MAAPTVDEINEDYGGGRRRTFHDLVDQAKYRDRPIDFAWIEFFDARGEVISSDWFRVRGKDQSTDTTSDREYMVMLRANEKFRDAVCRLGAMRKTT